MDVSWTIKKAEHQKTDAFEFCWGRFLRVPWTARRSNQSTLKEINPEYSLEGLMLKLELQYFGHMMWRTASLEKTLMLKKIEGRREKWVTEDEMVGWHYQFNEHNFEQILGVTEGWWSLACCSPWCHLESDKISDWTTIISMYFHVTSQCLFILASRNFSTPCKVGLLFRH